MSEKAKDGFETLWREFLKIAKLCGFKYGYSKKFMGRHVEEEEVILFHESKGLILYAETYRGKWLNNAEVYGEVKNANNTFNENQLKALKCFDFQNNYGTRFFCMNVSKYCKYYLIDLLENFELSDTWNRVPLLAFLNYMELKHERNYKAISHWKITESSPEVKKIIYGY